MDNPLRTLIVDDDALDRRAARRALTASGLAGEIVEVERGADALARLSEQAFDVVLLDFQLPDADGLEILTEIRAQGLTVPVIMLTGHSDDETAAELMKAGAADYLSKGKLSPEGLARSLRHVRRVHEAQAEAAQAVAEREALLVRLADEQDRTEAILSSMTDGLIVSDLDGNVVSMNPAALALHGYESVGEVCRPVREFGERFALSTPQGEPLSLDQWPLARAIRGETFSHYEVRVQRRDTGEVWFGSYGGTQVRSKSGEASLAVVTLRDVTGVRTVQQRAAFLAEASARLAVSLDTQATLDTVVRLAVPALADWCAVNVLDADGSIRPLVTAHVDPGEELRAQAMQQAYPLDPEAAVGVGAVIHSGLPQLVPQYGDAQVEAVAQDEEHTRLLRSFGTRSYLCVPLQTRGRTLGALSFARTRLGPAYGEDDLALADELGRRISAALDNAHLYEEARARAEREALINKIGSALRVSLDVDEVLSIVTEQVGQSMKVSRCSWAKLNGTRDAFEVAPQQYVAPGVTLSAYTLPVDTCPPEMVDDWTAGRPVVVADHPPGARPQAAEGLTPTRAFISCPVFLRGHFSGLFSVHQTDGPRRWSADEQQFLCAVADILALAMENARLYTREHRVADMLSSAFLTDIPDTLPGLDLSANYRSGLEEARVGGDYYDAFCLPDGRVALVIGDVSGKGLSAAVQTATVKYSLRAFATEAGAPGLVLSRLNRMLSGESSGLGEHFVTLFYALFEPATGRLAYASAGHETMIVKRLGGGVDLLGATGLILGIADHTYGQAEESLGVGDALLLFTDGLTEARSPETREMLEMDRVVEIVRSAPAEAGPGALAARLQQSALAWSGGRPHDDMALLVARRRAPRERDEDIPQAYSHGAWSVRTPPHGGAPAGLSGGRPSVSEEPLFAFSFPSRPDSAAEVRQALAHWMPALGFSREMTEDFQTAVTEAVTNAVRHGSPEDADHFRIRAFHEAGGALRVEVVDHGPGLPPGAFPPMPAPEAPGGRGLPLMRALSDGLEFRPNEAAGHTVTLLKRPLDRRRK